MCPSPFTCNSPPTLPSLICHISLATLEEEETAHLLESWVRHEETKLTPSQTWKPSGSWLEAYASGILQHLKVWMLSIINPYLYIQMYSMIPVNVIKTIKQFHRCIGCERPRHSHVSTHMHDPLMGMRDPNIYNLLTSSRISWWNNTCQNLKS